MDSVNRLSKSNLVEPVVAPKKATSLPVIEFTENKKEIISTPKEDLKIKSSLGSGNKSISFIENDNTFQDTKVSTKDSIKQLDNQIKNIITNQNIPPEKAKIINEKISDLSNFLNSNKLDNNEKVNQVNQKLSSILVSLKTSGVDTNKLNNHINQLISSVTNKVSQDGNLNLNIVSKNDNILGIESNSKNLTDKQKETISALKNTARETESIKAQSSGKISPSTLMLMSVRDELLRQSFERLSFPRQQEKQPNIVENDLKIISNMVSSVDKMMEGSRDLPPNMLQGLSDMTKSISSAPLGQIDKALQVFSSNLGNTKSPLGEIDNSLKNLSNTLGNTNKKLPNAGQLNNLPDTKALNDLNKQLLSLTQNTPTGVADNVKSVVESYSKAMNAVESSLPPILPFPVKIKVPIGYNDGSGNGFMLGSGSTLSQSGSGFQINSPSMLLQNGSTQVSAGNTNIQLGNKLDYLSMGNLDVKSGGTDTKLTNATAQINRETGSSVIKADKAVVNMTDGKVDLTNAGLYQNTDGSMKLAADSILYDKGDTHVGMKNFQALQSENAQKSNLNISSTNLDLKKAGAVVTADKMSFDLEKNKETGASSALLTGENIKIIKDGNNISADNAQVKLIQNADGSGLTEITAQNPNINLKDGSNLNVKGNTTLSMTQGANGQLKNINAKADEVNFQDKVNTAKVVGGNLNVNYDDKGKIKDLSANANSVNFKNKDSQINAQNASVVANYENDKITSSAGHVGKLDYT
ncbi:MAG: hypothetical protein AABZ74_04955, partial [Cyanobacteriota bacterium]